MNHTARVRHSQQVSHNIATVPRRWGKKGQERRTADVRRETLIPIIYSSRRSEGQTLDLNSDQRTRGRGRRRRAADNQLGRLRSHTAAPRLIGPTDRIALPSDRNGRRFALQSPVARLGSHSSAPHVLASQTTPPIAAHSLAHIGTANTNKAQQMNRLGYLCFQRPQANLLRRGRVAGDRRPTRRALKKRTYSTYVGKCHRLR